MIKNDKYQKIDLSHRIIHLREENNLSQTDLSKVLHIDRSSVSRMESGKRGVSIQEIIKMATYFNVTTDYLLGLKRLGNNVGTNFVDDLEMFLRYDSYPIKFGGERISEGERTHLKLAVTKVFYNRIYEDDKLSCRFLNNIPSS